MTPQPPPPPGQGPVDPRGAFIPPPPPGSGGQFQSQQSMPMGNYPPPMGFAPPAWFPPPRRERGFARAILTTFATTLFGISLMLNIYLLVISGLFSDHGGRSDTIIEGDPKQVVAVVPIVTTLITSADAENLDKQLKDVEANDNVKALVLRIDTPGGEVSPSDEMHSRILQFKLKHPSIPVVVSMGGLATSGGYYTAVAGDWLVAEPTTLTANIGVIQDSLNFTRLADKWGIDDTTLHNDGADFKSTGSAFRPPTTQEIAYMTSLLNSMADQFHQVVLNGRQGRIKAPLAQVFNAQAYIADTALKMGLVDQIGYLTDACKVAADKARLTNMTVIKFDEPSILQRWFSSKSSLPIPQAKGAGGLKINGVDVDSPQLDRLLNPHPLYLYRPN